MGRIAVATLLVALLAVNRQDGLLSSPCPLWLLRLGTAQPPDHGLRFSWDDSHSRVGVVSRSSTTASWSQHREREAQHWGPDVLLWRQGALYLVGFVRGATRDARDDRPRLVRRRAGGAWHRAELAVGIASTLPISSASAGTS